jgi:hypothetical protein
MVLRRVHRERVATIALCLAFVCRGSTGEAQSILARVPHRPRQRVTFRSSLPFDEPVMLVGRHRLNSGQ